MDHHLVPAVYMPIATRALPMIIRALASALMTSAKPLSCAAVLASTAGTGNTRLDRRPREKHVPATNPTLH